MSQKEFPFTYEEVGDLSDRKFFGFKSASRELRVKGEMTSDVGIAYLQGRKKTQEDRSIAESFEIQDLEGQVHSFMLTGVFDGHGGGGASAFMQDNLAEQLQSSLQEILDRGLELSDLEIWNLLKRVCVELSDIWNAFGTDSSGTTASFSFLKEGEDLWTVNVGDSRSFIASKDKVIQLTEDAKLSNQPILSEEGYKQRILDKKEDQNFYETRVWKGNGFVLDSRLDGILAMPRAIGDRALGRSVSARPKITKIAISKEFQEGEPCYLFHATDGLWDGVSTNQAANDLLEFDPIPVEIARRFTYSVGKGCPGDNISVVVAELTARLANS